MGDLRAVDLADFSPRLKALEAVRSKPTLDENDMYVPSPREAELVDRVCVEDCVVALANASLRRQLCLTLIQAIRPALAVIAGQGIGEDEEFLDYLPYLAPLRTWPGSEFKGVCLLEPDVLWSLIDNEGVKTANIGVLVPPRLRTLPGLVSRLPEKLFPTYSSAREGGVKHDSAVGDRRWSAGLQPGCPRVGSQAAEDTSEDHLLPRHSSKAAQQGGRSRTVRHRDRTGHRRWATLSPALMTPRSRKSARPFGSAASLRRFNHAEELSRAKHRAELQDFLQQSQRMLTNLKGRAILGAPASADDFKAWIQANTSIEGRHGSRRGHTSAALLILSELPYGVSCDALLTGSDHKVVLATRPEWKSWQESAELA
ncbi:hypothetical protein HPB48_025174 [Haemaphysalis longicornis]|uniref:Uncharacterized protein n=1 Tax=Haemaphysalis longicornis TaxID=44386 RepID=A0A9J6H9I1_HAELO|nr:hypothetical protein HPB48_025174 [Haemaphysalis longicornis]